MLQNIVDFKAKSFLTERNTSTIAYEVKGVRALWDPSLSIPGTNRRGGWRCPIGTRYGGQITDRFGRSCGWGVARRIANQISDIGERLENVDDARRGRRIARRERRILARLNPEGGGAGRLERGLRGVAERLDGGDSPSPSGARRRTVVARPPSVDAPDTPRELNPAPPAPRAPRRRRAPNLRESEQRRMEREIEQPGAPRTGEAPARPARPQGDGNLRESEQRRMDREIEQPGAPRTGEEPARPARPARRRRRAVVAATQNPKAPTQQEENVVDKPVVEPKIVKPRRPKKNPEGDIGAMLDAESEQQRVPRPAPRGQSDNAARSEEIRAEAARQADAILADADRERAFGMNQPNDFAIAFMPSVWDDLSNEERREFREQWRAENDALQDVRKNFMNRIRDEDFGTNNEDLRERIRLNNEEIINANTRLERDLQVFRDLQKPAPLEQQRVVAQNRRDALSRIAVNAQDRRRRELENKEFEKAIVFGDLQKATPAAARPNLVRRIDLDEVMGNDGFVDGINGDVIGARLRIINDAGLFPDISATDQEPRAEALSLAQEQIQANQGRLASIERAIRRVQIYNTDVVQGANEVINVQKLKEEINDVIEAWRTVEAHNLVNANDRVSALDKPSSVPNSRLASAPNPLDDPFKTPKPVEPIDAAKIAYKVPELDEVGNDARKKMLDDVVDKINNDNRLSEAQKRAEIQKAVVAIEELRYNNDFVQAEAIRAQQKKLLEVLENIQRGVVVETALEEYRQDFEGNRGVPAAQRATIGRLEAEVDAAWELLNRADANGQAGAVRNLDSKIQSYVEAKKSLELHERFENDLENAISRLEQGQGLDESKGDLAKKTPQEIVGEIAVDIEKAIEKRGKKLDEYLAEKWKDNDIPPTFEGMTPEKWQTLSQARRHQYLREAYGHKMIKGKNGKFYEAVVDDVSGAERFTINITFNEIDKDGNILRERIGAATRSDINPLNGGVYQQSFFIFKDGDKGSDIATIFNQHAFLYLSKIGITKAGVGPASDGRYVWGRVGFKTDRGIHTQQHFDAISGALNFYKKFGPGGLIATDEQYFKVKKLLELAKGGTKVHHQDFAFAVDPGKEMLDKARRDYIKHWFSADSGGLPLNAAYLNFGEQKIGAFVSPRKKKKKVNKNI